MESRPTSLTISCETSISLGTGCLHLSAGWPSAFFPPALLIVRCTVPRYGGMIMSMEHGDGGMPWLLTFHYDDEETYAKTFLIFRRGRDGVRVVSMESRRVSMKADVNGAASIGARMS